MTMPEERPATPRRSFIFSPGLKPEMFPKALASGADIVCVELEDGIAPKDKDEARGAALALFTKQQADDGVERIVRVNCLRTAFGLADVQAVLASETPPPALMLPKVIGPQEIVWLDDLLTERGHATRTSKTRRRLFGPRPKCATRSLCPRKWLDTPISRT